MLFTFLVLYTFIFCFHLPELIYFSPIYHMNSDGERSYTHKFPKNTYFLPSLDKLYSSWPGRSHPGIHMVSTSAIS